jgi:uncharacterized protein (TIGR02186 family)
MRARGLQLVAAALVAALVPCAARAEQLVLVPSTTTVFIRSNYIGTSVALFGAVQGISEAAKDDANYDVVVTITGPRQTLVARRKSRVFGIWVNADSRTFADVPSYLEVLANRPLASIAPPSDLGRSRIGLTHALPPASGDDTDAPFRAALVEIESERGVFAEKTNAITFFTSTLFRAEIVLPAHVKVGTYDIDVKLFSKGSVVAQGLSAFEVVKTGVVQFIADAAQNNSLLYGFVVTLMALAMGWLASIVFQRE